MLREIRNDDADRQEERDEEGELVELGWVVARALQGKTFPRDRCKCRERKRRHRAGGRASWKRRRREARLGFEVIRHEIEDRRRSGVAQAQFPSIQIVAMKPTE